MKFKPDKSIVLIAPNGEDVARIRVADFEAVSRNQPYIRVLRDAYSHSDAIEAAEVYPQGHPCYGDNLFLPVEFFARYDGSSRDVRYIAASTESTELCARLVPRRQRTDRDKVRPIDAAATAELASLRRRFDALAETIAADAARRTAEADGRAQLAAEVERLRHLLDDVAALRRPQN